MLLTAIRSNSKSHLLAIYRLFENGRKPFETARITDSDPFKKNFSCSNGCNQPFRRILHLFEWPGLSVIQPFKQKKNVHRNRKFLEKGHSLYSCLQLVRTTATSHSKISPFKQLGLSLSEKNIWPFKQLRLAIRKNLFTETENSWKKGTVCIHVSNYPFDTCKLDAFFLQTTTTIFKKG